jgi:hypothetical protein
MEEYYFSSEGDCEVCDAMEGWYDDEPPRPHPNCDCEIKPSSKTLGYSFKYEVGATARDPERPGEAFSIPVRVKVECFNGREIEDSIVVDFEISEMPEHSDWLGELERQAEETAEAYAEEMSESCGMEESNYAWDHTYEEGIADPEDNDHITIPILVRVFCANGRIIEDETSLEFEPDQYESDPFWDYLDDKIYEEASEAAAELADDCPEPSYEGRDVDDDYGSA